MVQRVTYLRRHPYKTRSNRVKVIRLPGGKLTVQYLRKKAQNAHCRVSGARLQGQKALRPCEMHRAKRQRKWKTAKRKYGGNLSHKVVKERIVRAFLLEERKIVRRVLKLQKAKEKSGKWVCLFWDLKSSIMRLSIGTLTATTSVPLMNLIRFQCESKFAMHCKTVS